MLQSYEYIQGDKRNRLTQTVSQPGTLHFITKSPVLISACDTSSPHSHPLKSITCVFQTWHSLTLLMVWLIWGSMIVPSSCVFGSLAAGSTKNMLLTVVELVSGAVQQVECQADFAIVYSLSLHGVGWHHIENLHLHYCLQLLCSVWWLATVRARPRWWGNTEGTKAPGATKGTGSL